MSKPLRTPWLHSRSCGAKFTRTVAYFKDTTIPSHENIVVGHQASDDGSLVPFLGMSRFLLNIEKRSLPRLMLSGDGLAGNDAM